MDWNAIGSAILGNLIGNTGIATGIISIIGGLTLSHCNKKAAAKKL